MITEKQILEILNAREENIDGGETIGIHCVNYGNVAKAILKIIYESPQPSAPSVSAEEILDKYESFHWGNDGMDETHYYKSNVLQAMQEYAQAQQGKGWVRVEDGLPDGRMEACLVFNGNDMMHKQHIQVANYFQQIGNFVTIGDYTVTHWMPLPSPPNQ